MFTPQVDQAVLPPADDTQEQWMFRLRHVRQTFDGRGGISIDALDLRAGAMTAIIGRSGSGKSTLLSLVGGVLAPEKDEQQKTTLKAHFDNITYDLENGVPSAARGAFAFVFQDAYLIHDASCADNVALSLAALDRGVDKDELKALWYRLGLPADKLHAQAHISSGGMQQRVAIARALIRNPRVVLSDEPTASLDPDTARNVMCLLLLWQRAQPGRSVIFVSHSIELAQEFADDIVVLAPPVTDAKRTGPGSLAAAGPWPRQNPRSIPLITSWMRGEHASEEHDQHMAVNCGSSGNSPPEPHRTSMTAPEASRRPQSGSRFGAFLTLARIALAMVLNGSHKKSRWRNILTGFAIATFVLWLAFFPIMSGYVETSKATIGAAGIILILLILPRVVARLGLTTYLRALAFAVLAFTGYAAAASWDIVQGATEYRLSSPDLQPILVSPRRHDFTTAFVADLQDALEGHKPTRTRTSGLEPAGAPLVPEARGIADRAVHGRHMVLQMPFFLPPTVPSESPPLCAYKDGNTPLHALAALGMSEDERLATRIGWWTLKDRPLQMKDLTPSTKRSSVREQPLRRGYWNGTNWDEPEAHISESLLRGALGLKPSDEVPLWLCLDVFGNREFTPFRITAVVPRIPDFDVQSFGLIIGIEVAAAATSKNGRENPFEEPYDLISIRLPPDDREATLNYLLKQDAQGAWNMEVGAQRLKEAMTASQVAVRLSDAFAYVVVALGCVVTGVFVAQFISANRRELAVARAFGARFWHVLCLVLILIGTALIAALAMVFLVAWAGHASIIGWIGTAFGFPVADLSGWIATCAWVALIGIAITVAISALSLLVWWYGSNSIAAQLKEVG